jgi:hypothetical protein
MRFALLAMTAAGLFAQAPEIRGSVFDQGSGGALQGVEVTLTLSPGPSARVVATAFTGKDGAFSFKPETFGQYQLDLKKAGYAVARGFILSAFFLSADYPLVDLPRFTLMNPSSVSGRLLDEADKPLAGFRVTLADPQFSPFSIHGTVTASDGTFTIAAVGPGTYLVHAAPAARETPKIEEYTDEAFGLRDQGWDDLSGAPFVVAPGSAAELGTLRLRQTERYRVRVNVQGDCSGNSWSLGVISDGMATMRAPCKQQLLLTHVSAGSYQVALWADGDNIRWAVAPLIVTRSNTAVNLTIAAAMDVPGRVVTSQGVPPPSVTGTNFLLMMRPDIPGLSSTDAQEPQVQADLSFVAHTLRWDHYRVYAPRVPAGYYVREIRYNGRPVVDGRIVLLPQAQLEFELDNQPGRVSGTVNDGGRAAIVLAKAPYDVPSAGERNAPFSYLVYSQDGRFDISGVAPGEYRIAAALDAAQLPALIRAGEKVTIERGQQRSVELKVVRGQTP